MAALTSVPASPQVRSQAITSPTCSAGRSVQEGMPVPGRPFRIVRARKASEASARKSGEARRVPIPPSPSRPWHEAQLPR